MYKSPNKNEIKPTILRIAFIVEKPLFYGKSVMYTDFSIQAKPFDQLNYFYSTSGLLVHLPSNVCRSNRYLFLPREGFVIHKIYHKLFNFNSQL